MIPRQTFLCALRWTAAFIIGVAGVGATTAAHAQLTTGCADGQREGFTSAPSIAGCSGAWSVPGIAAGATATFAPACARAAGDDGSNTSGTGCNVTDICAEGWHVCGSRQEVAARSPSNTCTGSVPSGSPSVFFATRETGNGEGSCVDSPGINNDLFGCGNLGATPAANCSPLNRFSDNLCANLNSSANVPWRCNSGANSDIQEALRVTKTTSARGGVLCCISPVTQIIDRPANPTNDNDDTFTFGGGTTYRCSLDGAAFSVCPANYSPGALPDGSHTLEVFAVDEFGNGDLTTESYTWVIDTLPPETTIEDGPGDAPATFVSSTSGTFDFSTVGGVSYECILDAGGFAPCSDPVTFNGLAQGSHTLQVRAVDAAGNVDASPAVYTWFVDTNAPSLTVTVPTPGQVFLPTTVIPVTFTTEPAASLQIRILGPGGSVPYDQTTPVFDPTDTINTSALAQGNYTAEVTSTDAAGNATTRTVAFVVDINECTTNNGGCDVLTTCTNSVGSFSCGACPAGYTGTGLAGCDDINECSTNNGGCDPLSVCTNTPGSFSCGACPTGYTGTGDTSCDDINECLTDNGGCDDLTVCTNTPGSRTCGACPSGYTGDGVAGCDDINECDTNNGGCDVLTACTNTPGSRTCGACPAGYTGDGVSGCDDINECNTNNGDCDPLTACINTPGSSTCGACPAGYTGDGVSGCDDINECDMDNGGCDPLTACTNTPGSRTCGACPTGYTGDGVNGCDDINECDTDNGGCDPLTACTNTPGSSTCGACPAGYTGDGDIGCTDMNECDTDNGGCDPLTACTNTPGSSTCGACPAGYTGDGDIGCTDINECDTDNGGCDPLTVCNNTPGSSSCGACPAGYTGTGATSCEDIDECLTDNGGCDPLTDCTNTPGGFTCGDCPVGYVDDGAGGCNDIDECVTDNGGCDDLTVCTNTDGGRTCGACPAGYTGDGVNGCNDIDECLTDNGGCDDLTVCTNTPGGSTCGACPAGYTGDGDVGCTDIDECLTDNGGCDPITMCTNTPGGSTCGACPAGYDGDGDLGCTDIDECLTDNGGCDALTLCTNIDGGRLCDACPGGYSGDGESGCVDIDECATDNGGCDALTTCTNDDGGFTCGACPAGYTGDGDVGCTDIDECLVDNGGCDELTFCTNTDGGFECGACPAGYEDDGVGGCEDIDECADSGLNNCDPLVECTNSDGGFECGACPEGYIGDGTLCEEDRTDAPPWVLLTSPVDGDVLLASPTEINGRTEPNLPVDVFINGELIGSTTADEDGNWTLALDEPLAPGLVELRAEATDEEGRVGRSDITFEILPTDALTIDSPSDGDVLNTPRPTLTGRSPAGATVEIFVDGESVGTVVADESGDWTWTSEVDLPDGPVMFTAETNESGTPQSVVIDVTIDTSAPGTVTIETPADGTLTRDPRPAVTGVTDPGATVQIFDGETLLGETTADDNGRYSFTPTADLTDGEHTLTARSGSAEDSVTITVDTLPPVLTVETPVADSTTGPGTVTVTGTSEPGATIELFADGVLVGSTTADEDGNWTADIDPELEDGPFVLEATATDEAGNQTVVSVDLIWDGEEVGEDVGPDAGDDVGTDAESDAGDTTTTDADAAVEPDTDAGSDAAADTISDVEIDTDAEIVPVDFRGGALLGCSATPNDRSVPGGWMLMLAGVVLWMRRRR